SDTVIDAEFAKRKGSLSEYGYATQVTAPMLMAATAVAGEVCNKLIAVESAQAAGQRRIFNSINFSADPVQVTNQELREVTRRIARSCWLRNESDEEFEIIDSNFHEAFSSGGAAGT